MSTQRTRIASAMADRTLAKGSSKAYAKEVAALLLSEGRVGELDSLLRDVQANWADKGHVEVLARSAHPLSGETQKDIRAEISKLYPQAKDIVVTEIADPTILGGVQLSLPGQQLDLSVEAKLNRFKQLAKAGKE